MNRQKFALRGWELALLISLCVSLCAGTWAGARGRALSSELVRLHVIGASNSEADQAYKLRVRDAVLARLTPALEAAGTREEAVSILRPLLPALEQELSVRAELGEEYYPSRDYGSFSLPAGEYLSLRVTVGAGAGRNWWCVVFPPLCLGSAEETEAAFSSLPDEDAALMGGGRYQVKFRAVELWGSLMQWLSGE